MTGTAKDVDFPHALMTAILDAAWWTPELHVRAMYGWLMRVHADAEHPDQTEAIAQLSTEKMTPAEREAWLFGYRFRDMPGPGGDGDELG